MSQSLLAPAAVNGRDWLILHGTDRKCFDGASSFHMLSCVLCVFKL